MKKPIPKGRSLAELYPDLVSQWHPTKNGDKTPWTVSAKSNEKFWWKCHNGKWPDGSFANDHEWEACCNNRVRVHGGGCPCCRGFKVVLSNCMATTHSKLAAQLHPTKNGELTAQNIVAGTNKTLWWKCYDGKWPDGSFADDHEWETTGSHRVVEDTECPCCARQKVVPSNCLATTHPHLTLQWHPTKNGEVTPWDIVAGSDKFWWKCYDGKWPDGSFADDHEWETAIFHRTNPNRLTGCPCCTNNKIVPSNSMATTHPEMAKKWHPTKNGNVKPSEVSANSNTRYWWKCYDGKWPDGSFADDHEWETVPNSLARNTGCPCCTSKKVVPSNCMATTHPHIAAEWCHDMNKKKPHEVHAGSAAKYWFKCKKGHIWKTCLCVRTRLDCGCFICGESKGEKRISAYLDSKAIKYVREHELRSDFLAYLDFLLDVGAIEFHGRQHYEPISFGSKKQYAKIRNLIGCITRDDRKKKLCIVRQIPLLVIPWWDEERIEVILDDWLSGRTPVFSEPPEVVKRHQAMRQKIRERYNLRSPEFLCGLF